MRRRGYPRGAIMAVYIRARHMVGGNEHQHIASVQWQNTQNSNTGTSTREVMVDWIKNKGGQAYVHDGVRAVSVGVIESDPPYLRTYADGVWADNLLALPTF